MPQLLTQSVFDCTPAELWRFHARPGAFQRLAPPWIDVRLERQSEGIANGAEVLMSVPAGPGRVRWLARHEQFIDGEQFVDRAVYGPMKRWVHQHRVTPATTITGAASGALLSDEVEYSLPLSPLSQAIAGGFVRRDLQRMFDFRHARTAIDLAAHRPWAQRGPIRILLSGASGLIGQRLVAFLASAGHTVDRLVRRAPRQTGDATPRLPGKEIEWDPRAARIEPSHLEGYDAIVHLGGVGVADKRWTAHRKTEILRSRTVSTALLAATVASLRRPPSVFIVASGTAIYAPSTTPVSESAPQDDSFLAGVCRDWEDAANPTAPSTRVVSLRLGPVLCAQGGFLSAMARLVRWALLGRLGTGMQVVPWLAMDDALRLIEHVMMTPSLRGPVNAVSPGLATNREILSAIGTAIGRPALIPVPQWAVRLLAGEMSDEVLPSRAVAPTRLLESGFQFALADIHDAVGFELGHPATLARLRSRWCRPVMSPAGPS